MRWGMPPPRRTGGPPVTNIRNTWSPHRRGWLKHVWVRAVAQGEGSVALLPNAPNIVLRGAD